MNVPDDIDSLTEGQRLVHEVLGRKRVMAHERHHLAIRIDGLIEHARAAERRRCFAVLQEASQKIIQPILDR